MTVSSANRRTRWEGNNLATEFSYDFPIFAPEDLKVVHTAPNGRETILAEGVDYTVAGAGNPEGGSVLYPLSGPPLAQGNFLTIVRGLSYTQELDIQNQAQWLPEVVEGALDRVTMLILQLLEQNDRTLSYSVGSAATDRTLPNPGGPALLGFSEEGHLVALPRGTEGDVTKSTFLSASDALGGYLNEKLLLSEDFTTETIDPGGNEALRLSLPMLGRVSANDASAGYLAEKMTAGSGISLTVEDEGSEEALQISAPKLGRVSANDVSTGYLAEKLAAGSGITLTVDDEGGEEALRISAQGGGLRNVSVFAASGTYEKPAWLKYAEIHVIGGGGGGGATQAYDDTGGGGGGGGGYAFKFVAAASIGASETVTVGAGGAGGSTGNGASGGASSFGSHCSATGGGGGLGTTGSDSGGAGGTGANGLINMSGSSGDGYNGSIANTCRGGAAAGPFGGQGGSSYSLSGLAFGGGGSGAKTNGGGGASGVVVIREYSV